MFKKKDCVVFFSCDDNYTPFLSVTLQSLVDNANPTRNYIIKVLHANSVFLNTQNRIKSRYEKENISIDFVDISAHLEDMADKLFTRDYYSKSTYYRLFIPRLFPRYKKAVYLDADLVLLRDVGDLFDENLGCNLVGAVPDSAVDFIPEFRNYVENRLGMSSYKNYFNAGVLVMNLAGLRRIRFENQFVNLMNKILFTVAQDQDYLNVILKGRVKLLPIGWNKMPIIKGDIPDNEIYLIHYNLSFKPWQADNINYSDLFFKYANKCEYAKEIQEIKLHSSPDVQQRAKETTKKLISMCEAQAEDFELNKQIIQTVEEIKYSTLNKTHDELMKEREKVVSKLNKLELLGEFDKDAESDPISEVLLLKDVDYMRTSIKSKINTLAAYFIARQYLNKLLITKGLILKEIKGLDNLKNLKSGAILTCNHLNPLDSFLMQMLFDKSKQKHRKFYKVIKESNYTSYAGFFGYLMRNCNTLPLSSNTQTMREFLKSVKSLLKKGNFILFYPEQSMWWNYKKPRPLKKSAYKLAVENNVPLVPVFITMKTNPETNKDEFTINVGVPKYKDRKHSVYENVEKFKEYNYVFNKMTYENFYGEKLTYNVKSEFYPQDFTKYFK